MSYGVQFINRADLIEIRLRETEPSSSFNKSSNIVKAPRAKSGLVTGSSRLPSMITIGAAIPPSNEYKLIEQVRRIGDTSAVDPKISTLVKHNALDHICRRAAIADCRYG